MKLKLFFAPFHVFNDGLRFNYYSEDKRCKFDLFVADTPWILITNPRETKFFYDWEFEEYLND